MIETPRGVLNAAAIAAAPGMAGFVMGTNDLAKELGCRHRRRPAAADGRAAACLLAARAAGIVCVDGVYNAFRDEEGLRAECEQGRDLGMDGKTLIHPAQIAIANDVFAPSEAEIELARRQIAAFDEATAAGQGVAVVDGRIVENLHVATARATLAKAEAIARAGGCVMVWLILGVLLWCGAHLFKRLAPEARARHGRPGQGDRRRPAPGLGRADGDRLPRGRRRVLLGPQPGAHGHQQPADADRVLPLRGVRDEDAGHAR